MPITNMLFDLGIKKKSSLKTDMKPKKTLEKETHLQTADVWALWIILGAASKHKTIHTKPFSTRFFKTHPAHLCCPITNSNSCICSIIFIITLRIIGPSNGGVCLNLCSRGVWVLKIATRISRVKAKLILFIQRSLQY